MNSSFINFYEFSKLHHGELKKKWLEAMEEIFTKNSFIEGPANFALEKKLSEFFQTKYCSLVANGTDALEIALQSLDLPPKSFVALPTVSFYASAEAICNAGHIPLFIEVDSQGLMDIDHLEKALELYPIKAVMPVHLFGLPVDTAKITQLCRSLGVSIIEDAAQAFGTLLPSTHSPLGSSGNILCLSFYPTKNLGAFGDAGAILYSEEEIHSRILSLRNHGRSPNGYALLGRNSRCDHIQATTLLLKFEESLELNKKRREIACLYHEFLAPLVSRGLELIPKEFLPTSSWHLYPLKLPQGTNKQQVLEKLKSHSIGAVGHYYAAPLPKEKTLENFLVFPKLGPSCDFTQRVICLPMHPYLTLEQIKFTCEALASCLA